MSYNVMGLMSLALVCVLMLTAEKHPAADMYFAGVFVAVLVLNCPFAVAIYIIYALAVLVLTLMRKRGRVTGEGFGGCAFMPRSLMWSAFGAGTLFGVQVMPESYLPMGILVKPAGGFIVLGLTLALVNKLLPKKA